MKVIALRGWWISRKPQTDRLLDGHFSSDPRGIWRKRAPIDRYVWLFQIRPWVPEECDSPDCFGSEAFDCAPAAQLCSRILPPAVCDFMSGLTWSVVVLLLQQLITWLDGGGAVLVVTSNLVPRSSRIDSYGGFWAEACFLTALASEPDSGSMVRVVAVGRQAAFNCWHDRTPAGRVVYC